MSIPCTTDIARTAHYFSSADSFFDNFSSAWDAVRCQVLKLETRQSYDETGNKAYNELVNGDLNTAIKLLPETKEQDKQLYSVVREKRIEFIRCRPLVFPLNQYMKWEMAAYDINSSMGERIFCCNYDQINEIMTNNAKHDFMVFDRRVAFIHNYNESGAIEGGWIINNLQSIHELIYLYGVIKAECRPYELYKS